MLYFRPGVPVLVQSVPVFRCKSATIVLVRDISRYQGDFQAPPLG